MRFLTYVGVAYAVLLVVWYVLVVLSERLALRRAKRLRDERASNCAADAHREILITSGVLSYRCLDCGEWRHVGVVWFGASNHKSRRTA